MPQSAPLPDEPDDAGRYLALCARDARFDGQFFTGVTSTGIYCRPVCAVRTPRRENCRFFDLAAQAEHAGFRPCLRCRPEVAPARLAWSAQDATALLLAHALRLIAASPVEGAAPTAQIAARLGVSDRHLRRIFEARLGVTPLRQKAQHGVRVVGRSVAQPGRRPAGHDRRHLGRRPLAPQCARCHAVVRSVPCRSAAQRPR